MPIRVLIAEDQSMVLGALAALLEIESDIEVVARAHDGREALMLAQRSDPDVVLTDIEMPNMTGLEMAAELNRTRKGQRPRVIILTTFARPGYLRRALEAGASGYLLKDAPAEKLADAIRGVHQGLRVVDPQLAQDAWGEADPLTDRERQVLRAAEEGLAERRHCETAEPVGRHRQELPVRVDRQAGRLEPHRGRASRPPERLVVS